MHENSLLLGGLFEGFSLLLLSLSLDLGSSLVVIRQVAGLAHTHGVQKAVMMLTLPSILVSSELSVARRAHVFSVVLSVGVWALGDCHDSRSLIIIIARLFSNFMLIAFVRIMFLFALFSNLLLRNVQLFRYLAVHCIINDSSRLCNFIRYLSGSLLRLLKELLVDEVLEKLSVELAPWFIRIA